MDGASLAKLPPPTSSPHGEGGAGTRARSDAALVATSRAWRRVRTPPRAAAADVVCFLAMRRRCEGQSPTQLSSRAAAPGDPVMAQ